MAKIESVGFGNVAVDGRKYRLRDVLIFPDGTVQRRKFGRWICSHHKLGREDIADLIAAGVQTVVIGTGIKSGARLSDDIRDYAREAKFEIVALPSREASHKFNELATPDNKAGALIHIMC